MKKTSSTQELENKFITRALMIENVLDSSEAIYVWQNCNSYRYNRIDKTRLILRVKCSMLWEMAAELNKLNK